MSQDYTTNRHLTIDWAMFHRDIQLLAANLAGKGPFKGMIAIARGGLVPAGILSRLLDLRLVDTLCVSSYDDRVQRPGTPELLKGVEGDGDGWLVIDDLVDTGTTMRIIRDILPKAYVGVLYAKPVGRPLADSFVREFPQDSWIDFPWEMLIVV